MLVLGIVKTLFRRGAGERSAAPNGLAHAVGHYRDGDLTTLFKLFEYKFLYFLIKLASSAILLRDKMGSLRPRNLGMRVVL